MLPARLHWLTPFPILHIPISVTHLHYPNAHEVWIQSLHSLLKSLVTSLGIPCSYLRLSRICTPY